MSEWRVGCKVCGKVPTTHILVIEDNFPHWIKAEFYCREHAHPESQDTEKEPGQDEFFPATKKEDNHG